MKKYGIECLRCGDKIYSRARHDLRWCSCGSCAIDGGEDYMKVSGDPAFVKNVELELDVDKQVLYDDWSKRKNKYGLIKGFSKVEKFGKGEYKTKK
jgi:hypothetical protein